MIEFAPELLRVTTYDTAWLYCATLTHNNKYDWRIPTAREISNEGLNDIMFPNFPWCQVHHLKHQYVDRENVTRNGVMPVRTKDD
jgi:hypothetical protein